MANLLPMIRELRASGIVSHNAIAAALNARGVRTLRGREWSHVHVGAVLARAGAWSDPRSRDAASGVDYIKGDCARKTCILG